eukprot:scaffold6203_cov125-Cylindrotheca_fusiformis.AAC.2
MYCGLQSSKLILVVQESLMCLFILDKEAQLLLSFILVLLVQDHYPLIIKCSIMSISRRGNKINIKPVAPREWD